MRKGDLLASSSKVDASHCRHDFQISADEAATQREFVAYGM